MKLKQFRVKDFKSIQDSGEITSERITSFIGVNEAGKSNILLALWKLNPARGGEIHFTSDMPVSKVAEYRTHPENYWFIKAWLEISDDTLLEQLSTISGIKTDYLKEFSIQRFYDGHYKIDFYKFIKDEKLLIESLRKELVDFKEKLEKTSEAGKGETKINFKESLILTVSQVLNKINSAEKVTSIIEDVNTILTIKKSEMASSTINPLLIKLKSSIEKLTSNYNTPHPNNNIELKKIILDKIPTFVYYANYGNLDSQIYLPRVIDDFKHQTDTSEKALAKQRTLKVLFEYVNLNPEEILEMGKNYRIRNYNNVVEKPTDEEIEIGLEKTKEREILLNSASSKLTRGFKNWWKQGEYTFDLRADGDYFRIWVSDNKRPDKISLEDRSTGLQWFLSFYMVFLVESQDSHQNCILLLDEAGTTLHPLAQKDLLKFFESLSGSNQLLTTTHSPFMVDVDNLERTKVVYINEEGFTMVSDDLRANEKSNSATGAVYAVHAALGLSISDGMLNGCKMVIVEGISDQYYLNGIKQYLIAKGKINPPYEIIFMPAGGVKSVKQLSSIVAGKQNTLPIVFLDSDKPGIDYKNRLVKDLYVGQEDKIIIASELINIDCAEVEDIFPKEVTSRAVERIINERDFRFEDNYNDNLPLIKQIEEWSQKYDISLSRGYKVELAKDIKEELFRYSRSQNLPPKYVDAWVSLFEKVIKF